MIPLVDKLVREMLPMQQVANYLGVTYSTFNNWRAMGEDPECTEPLYREFAATILRARAEMTQAGIGLLRAHAVTDWRALMEILRAADPDTWIHQTKVKVDKNVNHTTNLDLSRLSDEELAQYERLMLAAGAKE
jgi:hypothetical protein